MSPRKLFFVAAFSGLAIFGMFSLANASSAFDIEFPIQEFGNCADKESCRSYCDDLSHKNECVLFARSHGFLSEEDAGIAEKLPEVGPGGCKAEKECREYCEDPSHLDECLAFAEGHGLMSDEDIRLAREFQGQTGPGGCHGANDCRVYCEDPQNQEECLEFARRKGLITDRDAEVARRVMRDGGPGGCKSEKECRAYCEEPGRLDQCLEFAEKEGFISKEEAERIRKSGAKAGFVVGPGGCKGEEECRAYCEEPANQAGCIDWAAENGFMSADEAARARKFVDLAGPGGCRGKQCRTFCENSENAETCLEFAEREGILPPEEVLRARKFLRASQAGGPGGCRGTECRDYCENPEHRDECFDFAKKQGLITPEEEKQLESGLKIQKKMQESGGPGGCRTEEECRAYCSDAGHIEECAAFASTHGGIDPEEARRMVREFTEKRFEARGEFGLPEELRRFEEEARKRFDEFRQLEERFRGSGGGLPGEFYGSSGGSQGMPGGFSGKVPCDVFVSGGISPCQPQSAGFSGPGGCTSPAECIKYCTEHLDECLRFGAQGIPEFRPQDGGVPLRRDFYPEKRYPDSGGQNSSEAVKETKPSGSGGTTVNLTSGSAGLFDLVIRARAGVKDFSLQPATGSNYGGGVPGCPREFKSTNIHFPPEAFPLLAVVVDCNDYKVEVKLGEGFRVKETPQPLPLPDTGLREESGDRSSRVCPSLPAVESCPSGQKKEVAFSSPECGTYYICIPEFSAPPLTPTTIPSSIEDALRTCVEHGGAWDGTTCRLPSAPSGFDIQNGSANALRALFGAFGL